MMADPRANAATIERVRLACTGGIALMVLFTPLAVGTVHALTRTVVFLICAATLALTLVERWMAGKRIALTVPLAALGAAIGLTALQLVPLPAAWIEQLSPAAHRIFEDALGSYRHHSLSLDPPGTAGELAKLTAYAACYMAVASYASRRQQRLTVIALVAAAGTIVSLIGLAQAAFGTSNILFFYKPQQEWGTLVRGTFVNPNHLGALLTISAPCALVIALAEPRFRVPASVATALINIASVLTLARAGIATVVLSQAGVFALLRLRRAEGPGTARALLGPVLVAAATIGAAAFAADRLEDVWAKSSVRELDDPSSKFQAWRDGAELARAYPLTGVGRGAFELAFPQVSRVAGHIRFAWIENGYLQAIIDWGMPGALLLAVLAVWSFLLGVRRSKHDVLLGAALAGTSGLALHEIVDFSVELPGVALPALALLATLHARRGSDGEPGRWRMKVRLPLLAAPAVVGLLALIPALVPTAATSAAALAREVRDASVPVERVVAAGTALRQRHPADYYVPLAVASRLAAARNPEAIRWANAAILLNPHHPAPHLVAADLLARRGVKDQALIEYREAARKSADARNVWSVVVRRYAKLPDLLRATPDERLALLADWLGATGRHADAAVVYARLLEAAPRDVGLLRAVVRMELDRGDAAAALRHLANLTRLDGGTATRALEVRARIAAGDLAAAEARLDRIADRSGDTFELELAVAEAHSKAGNHAKARARLEALPRGWQMDTPMLVRTHELRAAVERRAGNEHQARWELDRRDELLRR